MAGEEIARILRSRRMVRSFVDRPVPPTLVDELLDLARRAPSAGNTQPMSFLVLDDPDAVDRYWATTMPDETARTGFRWQGLLHAPVLVVPYVEPAAYPRRYAEDDKARTGLGRDEAAWPVPYWWIDAGAAVENLLVAAHGHGLGACLFGQFDHEAAVRAVFGVPEDRRAVGTVALGWPDATGARGRSAGRARPALDQVVHRRRWR